MGKVKIDDLEDVLIILPNPEKEDENLVYETVGIHEFLSRISSILLSFLNSCSTGLNDDRLESEDLLNVFGVAIDLNENFVDEKVKTFFINEYILLPFFNSFLHIKKTAEEFANFDLVGDIEPSGNLGLLAFSDDFDKVIIRLWVQGYTHGSEKSEIRVLLLPFRKTLKQGWIFLERNALAFKDNADFIFQCKSGNFLFEKFSNAWKDAVFAISPEEVLSVIVKHYLLIPNDANPLTILLRSPQPTKGIAKQIENLLREPIS